MFNLNTSPSRCYHHCYSSDFLSIALERSLPEFSVAWFVGWPTGEAICFSERTSPCTGQIGYARTPINSMGFSAASLMAEIYITVPLPQPQRTPPFEVWIGTDLPQSLQNGRIWEWSAESPAPVVTGHSYLLWQVLLMVQSILPPDLCWECEKGSGHLQEAAWMRYGFDEESVGALKCGDCLWHDSAFNCKVLLARFDLKRS